MSGWKNDGSVGTKTCDDMELQVGAFGFEYQCFE